MDTFTITSTIKKFPTLSYEVIKNDILGKTYQLSLVFVGTKRAQQYNQKYRQKDYIPNVLSFPLATTQGEIIICPQTTLKEAAARGMTYDGYIGFLFVHGCLHLKGHAHGEAMDALEKKYIRKHHLT